MERTIIFICVITYIIGLVILFSIRLFENSINKKINKLNAKIDDMGFKCNDIESQNEDIYTKLNLLSSMLNDIRDSKNSFYINNNKPGSEK